MRLRVNPPSSFPYSGIFENFSLKFPKILPEIFEKFLKIPRIFENIRLKIFETFRLKFSKI